MWENHLCRYAAGNNTGTILYTAATGTTPHIATLVDPICAKRFHRHYYSEQLWRDHYCCTYVLWGNQPWLFWSYSGRYPGTKSDHMYTLNKQTLADMKTVTRYMGGMGTRMTYC